MPNPPHPIHGAARTAARLLVALAACTVACTTTATLTIAHPLRHAGTVPENRVVSADVDLSMQYHVPVDTFAAEASLSILDDARACFVVTVRADGSRETMAQLHTWRATLSSDEGYRDEQAVFGPTIESPERQVQAVLGNDDLRTDEPCALSVTCNRDAPALHVESVPTIFMVHVLTGRGEMCFHHNGAIHPSTALLELDLADPTSARRHYTFRWRFAGS